MNRLIFLLMMLIGSSCSVKHAYDTNANTIIDEFCNQMNQQGYSTFSTGGSFTTDIKMISLEFVTRYSVSIPEARIRYVEMMDQFLCKINEGTEIRPYLRDYPFTDRNVELTLSFSSPDTEVSGVFIVRGILYYCKIDQQKEDIQTIYSEPYDQAVEIVRSGKMQ